MTSTTWPVHSPFAREHFGKGRAQGRKEGHAEGRAEGEAHAVLLVLAARGIDVPDDIRSRITNCADQTQLDTWLKRALTATSVTELFD